VAADERPVGLEQAKPGGGCEDDGEQGDVEGRPAREPGGQRSKVRPRT
jgi:hypothetical protein